MLVCFLSLLFSLCLSLGNFYWSVFTESPLSHFQSTDEPLKEFVISDTVIFISRISIRLNLSFHLFAEILPSVLVCCPPFPLDSILILGILKSSSDSPNVWISEWGDVLFVMGLAES